MPRTITFTQAQVRRAVKGAESAGLCVRRVIVNRDGSIIVDSGESDTKTVDVRETTLASWDDA